MVEEYVLQLDVSVDDAILVDVIKTAEKLLEVELADIFLKTSKLAVGDQVAECSPVVELHGETEELCVRANLVELDNIWVT